MKDSSLGQRLAIWVSGLRLLVAYYRAYLPADLTGGIVVTLVLIPSAIAYAHLAKCPPVAGLCAALGGMVFFALFTSSRQVITGPDAAVAILVRGRVVRSERSEGLGLESHPRPSLRSGRATRPI